MSRTVDQIAAEALSLPNEARAMLVDRLVESLDPADDTASGQLWAAEAMRRLGDVRSGRVKVIPGQAAIARVRGAIGQ